MTSSINSQEIFTMLPEGTSRLFIPGVKFDDLTNLMSVIYNGNVMISEENYQGLQKVARVLKVELPDEDEEEEEEGIIAVNNCQAILDSSATTEQVVDFEEEIAVSQSKIRQRVNTLPISKSQRTRKRKSVKVEDEGEVFFSNCTILS